MIMENDKIYLNRSLISMSADINIKRSTIFAETLMWLFGHEALLYGKINVDDILFVTDRDEDILLKPEDFMYGTQQLPLIFPMHINVINAHVFSNLEKIPDIVTKIKTQYKVIVVGFINNININAFNNILWLNRDSANVVIVYGDELLDSIENKNYHRTYLSNNNLSIKLDYSENRINDTKKICGAIAKMRKSSDLVHIATNAISVQYINTITSGDLISLLDTFNPDIVTQIIVPKSIYHDIISDIYNRIYCNEDIFIKMFRNYYLKMPYIHIVNNGKDTSYVFLDAMTCVTVTNIHYISSVGYKMVVSVDMNVVNGRYAGTNLYNVILDFNSYIWNFNPDKHIIDPDTVNMALVNYALNEENIWDAALCQVVPFPICTYETAKYVDAVNTHAFIETLECNDINKPAKDLYQVFCKTKQNIYVYQSDVFSYI